MTVLVKNQFMPGKFNNYLIAGNVCNAFVIGELGSQGYCTIAFAILI